jgi:DNA repair exonuclease SbcCD ATPase subunit
MTTTPIQVSTDLSQVLGQINQNLKETNQKLDALQKDVTDIKIGQVRLEAEIKRVEETLSLKVDGLSKRLENQEFISRGVLVALIVTIVGGFARLFGFIGNS